MFEREGDGEREMIQEKCDLGGCEGGIGQRQSSDRRAVTEGARGQREGSEERHTREAVIREVAAVSV